MRVKDFEYIITQEIKDYFTYLELSSTKRTVSEYKVRIEKFFQQLNQSLSIDYSNIDHKFLEELNPSIINDYLKKYNNKSTAKSHLNAIKSLYKYLELQDYISKNPTRKVPTIKIPKKLVNSLSENESLKLFQIFREDNGINKERNLALFVILLTTGMRISEVLSINIEDFNQNNHSIKIRRKGDKEQNIFLSDEALQILDDYLKIRKSKNYDNNNALFLSKKGNRLSVGQAESIIRNYAKKIGLKATPHTLRHTFGNLFYEKNNDIYLVSQAMGHADVKVTTQYYMKQQNRKLQESRNSIILQK